ncbi:MAG: LacI family transcriptional regulator [Deltaproteobacteria bacterium]|nr:LacI family transcriptional regulator [Deltaproteobacteria bacterium]
MPSTIRDVAKIAEVSVATVSRVLNRSATVKEGTRQRVLKAIEECGFTYNAIARSLSTRKSVTIGVIVPAITNPVFAQSTKGIQDFANSCGYSIILGNSDYSSKMEDQLVEVFKEKRVEGIVLTCSDIRHEYIQRLKHSKLPFVLLYNIPFDKELNLVTIDNYKAAYEIVEHLIHLGHRRIGMIAGYFNMSDRSLVRSQGFKACLNEHGISFQQRDLIETDLTFEGGKRAMKTLLEVTPPLTGIFCSNDFIGMGAIKTIREKGLRIPGDISIAGFDDIEMASYFYPELTTIHQPAYQMGVKGAELLFKILSGEVEGPRQIILDHSLIVRNSCGPVNQLKQ